MLVELSKSIHEEVNNQIHELTKRIKNSRITGVVELIPAYCSVLINYNPLLIGYEELVGKVESLSFELEGTQGKKKRIHKIPCCYGARFGQDLADMEKYTGLDRDEIIKIHSSVDYKIFMLGFLPGFVYLGGLDKRLEMPRLENPRVKIYSGAVGIGGSQTGVYPLASPGGWRLIGGTPVEFYNPERERPILCNAGEYIRFVPICLDEYYDLRRQVTKGQYEVELCEEVEE